MWGFPGDGGPPSGTTSDLDAIKGNLSASAGSVSGTFRDVLTLGCDVQYQSNCPISGLATVTSLSLTGAYAGVVRRISFYGTKLTSGTAAVPVGTWNTDTAMTGNFMAKGAIVIGADKSLTVTNVGGCAFSGALVSVANAPYFRLNVTSVTGACANGISATQINGVVFVTTDLRPMGVIHVLWHDTAYKQAFWSSGLK